MYIKLEDLVRRKIKMKKNRSKKVNLETATLIALNAFAIGMFLQKILICGTSWMSTIGYLK